MLKFLQSYASLSFLLRLNYDRIITTATVIGSLYFATYILLR